MRIRRTGFLLDHSKPDYFCVRMRSSLVVRASDCQCTSCNGPGFDRHSEAADEAVLNIVWKRNKKIPPKIKIILCSDGVLRGGQVDHIPRREHGGPFIAWPLLCSDGVLRSGQVDHIPRREHGGQRGHHPQPGQPHRRQDHALRHGVGQVQLSTK